MLWYSLAYRMTHLSPTSHKQTHYLLWNSLLAVDRLPVEKQTRYHNIEPNIKAGLSRPNHTYPLLESSHQCSETCRVCRDVSMKEKSLQWPYNTLLTPSYEHAISSLSSCHSYSCLIFICVQFYKPLESQICCEIYCMKLIIGLHWLTQRSTCFGKHLTRVINVWKTLWQRSELMLLFYTLCFLFYDTVSSVIYWLVAR